MNLGDFLRVRGDPARIVLIETGPDGASVKAQSSAEQIDALASAVARGLLRKGLQRGDRIGILSLNRTEFVAVYFGAMRAGLVAVPINWKLPADTVAYIVHDAGIKIAFAGEAQRPLLPANLPAIGFDGRDWQDFLDFEPFDRVESGTDEIAQILYTSGSTGRPKGVPLTHAGQAWAVEAFSTSDFSHHRLLIAAPMFHMNALFNLKFTFRNNASCVLMPQFTPGAYIAAIAAHKVTWITSVPTMLAMVDKYLGKAPAPPAFQHVTRVFMGSSPFGQALLGRVSEHFPNAQISNSYGTTEAGPAVFGPHPAGLTTPGLSMGYPLGGIDLRIADDRGEALVGPTAGVLQMKTPALMPGYLNLPANTQAAIRDGWYHTNDVVQRDKNGFYFFVGRADDMFVSGGENIYPGEVEKLLERHPGVQQAIVVPVADGIKQALPFAFVVRTNSAEPVSEAALKAWALEQAPAYQHPRWFEFLDAIPLAGTNKIDRSALKARAEAIAQSRGR
jgi:long-chain acyl-CoA synthetase